VPSPAGGMQSFSCPGPQEYVTVDGASRGWACFDSTTGVWLLNALPPAPQVVQVVPQPVPQQTIVYQAPPPAGVYAQPGTVVYTVPAQTVIVNRPVYPSSVVIGAAAINAAGRIASAAIISSHRHVYYTHPVRDRYYRY